jgi:hypothetical protein
MRQSILILLVFSLFSGLTYAEPPRVEKHKGKQLGIRLWSELGKRALIHHARKRLTDVTEIDEALKEEYISKYAKATVAIILYEFASGTGPTTRYFHDKQPFTEEFKQGPAMQYMLNCYHSQIDSTGDSILLNGRYQFSGHAIPFVAESWPNVSSYRCSDMLVLSQHKQALRHH